MGEGNRRCALSCAKARLPREREPDCPRGPGGYDKEGVPCVVNLFGLREAGEPLAEEVTMVLDESDGLGVAQVLLEFGGADDVGEKERQDGDAVFALKGFDFRAMLDCQRQVHAFLWDCGGILGRAEDLASKRLFACGE